MNNFHIFLIFVAISAIVLNKIIVKKVANNYNSVAVTYVSGIVSVALLLPSFIIAIYQKDVSNALVNNWHIVLIGGFIWLFAGSYSTYSIKHGDVSLREPIISTRLIWVTAFGVLIFGEGLNSQKIIGIILILTGIIFTTLNLNKIKNLKLNINNFDLFSKGVTFSFLSAFITGIAVTFDKYSSSIINVNVYTFFMFLIPTILYSLVYAEMKKDVIRIIKSKKLNILIIGLTQTVYYYFCIKLYIDLPVSTVYPLLQFSAVVTVVAAIIFLKERENIKQRVLGCIIASVGVVVMKLPF